MPFYHRSAAVVSSLKPAAAALFTLLAFSAAALLVSTVAADAAAPHIVFTSKTQTVDHVDGGATAHFAFQVRNDGGADLNITDVRPGCGCTVASFDHLIPPGRTGTISADVHTGALWGQVVKTMVVYSNDPTDPTETLLLVVQVTPAYTVTPEGTQTIHYTEAQPIVRTFDVALNKQGMKLLDTPVTDGPITAAIAADPKQAGEYHVTLTLTPPATGGDVMGSVDIPTSDGLIPAVHLSLSALGDRGISTSPAIASFGTFSHSFNQPIYCTVGVFSRGPAFHVTQVESDDPRLGVQFMSQGTAISWYDVKLTYRGGWKMGKHQGVITIHTDSPMAPVLKVQYWANVE